MKKILLFALFPIMAGSCDYSVNSNGNIDKAYAHEVKEAEESHEAHTATTHHVEVANPAVADSTKADTSVQAHAPADDPTMKPEGH